MGAAARLAQVCLVGVSLALLVLASSLLDSGLALPPRRPAATLGRLLATVARLAWFLLSLLSLHGQVDRILQRRRTQNALLSGHRLHRVHRVHAAQVRRAHNDLVALVDGARHASHKLLQHVHFGAQNKTTMISRGYYGGIESYPW